MNSTPPPDISSADCRRLLIHPSIMQTELYGLNRPWDEAIRGWVQWLAAAGASFETIRLRRAIVRSIARRSATAGPADLTGEYLVALFGSQRWSLDHRRNVRAALHTFYEWCIQTGITTTNPAAELPKMRGARPRPRPVTDSIWDDLLAAAAPREQLMARLAGEAGLRRAEVSRVHRDDIIHDLLGYSLIVKGKGGKQRTVPITDSLATAIQRYRCIDYNPHGWLFPGNTDGHISPVRVGMLVSALMPPGWSMHKLRHRYASRGFAGTGNLRAVQEALGHSSVATTQHYTAVSSRDVRAVSEAAS